MIEPKPFSQAQPVAAQAGCTYAVVPLITTWEDLPYWRGRDHVVITMHLMQVATWLPSSSVTFDQHSGNSASHDTPASDILNDGFDEAISAVLAPPAGAVQAVSGDDIMPVPMR